MTSLHALSWNIGANDEVRVGQRMEKLCLEILLGGDLMAAMQGRPLKPLPELLLLQEMTRRAWVSAFSGHLKAAGFVSYPEVPLDREDHCLLAVRPPWSFVKVEFRDFENSPLRRQALWATLRHADGTEVCVCTAHMESLRSGGDARLSQAREIDQWLHEVPAGIFVGDTNLRRAEWEDLAPDFRSKDAFEVAGRPSQARHTWLHEASRRGYRFDRAWLRGVELGQFWLRKPPRNATDHFGVEIKISL